MTEPSGNGSERDLLVTQNVSKSFGAIEVLHAINFRLRESEVHAVIGENGAGKSTLMKLLGGYLEPSSGSLHLSGEPVEFRDSSDAEARGIVLIHQELNLAEDLTVEENIFLGRERTRGPFVDKQTMKAEVTRLLSDLETTIDPGERVRNLSVSQKQMVEIAKAVARDARIFIMDEPTDVLSGSETDILFALINRLQQKGVTVVYISHKLEEVKRVAERVTVLRDGRLITTRSVDELSQDEMATLMVGRELSDMYPEKSTPRSRTVFAVKSMNVPGWAKDVSFELKQGEVLGFAGLVGAGRTELFEGVLGLRPRRGEVYRNGQQVTLSSPRDAADLGIVYLSEDRKGKGILVDMKLRPNVTLLSLERYAHPFIDVKKEKKTLQQAAKTFDLRAPSLEVRARDLSGGNQQKIALAKIMDIDPDVIILDEPTRGIDVGTKRELYFFVHELIKKGKSCVLISSDMPELIGLSHRVLVMREGRIVGRLEGEAILEETIVRYATGLSEEAGYATSA